MGVSDVGEVSKRREVRSEQSPSQLEVVAHVSQCYHDKSEEEVKVLYGVPRRYVGSCGVSCELISRRCQLSWSAAPPVPLFIRCGHAELRHSYCRCCCRASILQV